MSEAMIAPDGMDDTDVKLELLDETRGPAFPLLHNIVVPFALMATWKLELDSIQKVSE